MKRCKTCKFWERENSDSEWGSCLKTITMNGNPDNQDSLAIAYDFEGYTAELQTSAKFGCVQWERK